MCIRDRCRGRSRADGLSLLHWRSRRREGWPRSRHRHFGKWHRHVQKCDRSPRGCAIDTSRHVDGGDRFAVPRTCPASREKEPTRERRSRRRSGSEAPRNRCDRCGRGHDIACNSVLRAEQLTNSRASREPIAKGLREVLRFNNVTSRGRTRVVFDLCADTDGQ